MDPTRAACDAGRRGRHVPSAAPALGHGVRRVSQRHGELVALSRSLAPERSHDAGLAPASFFSVPAAGSPSRERAKPIFVVARGCQPRPTGESGRGWHFRDSARATVIVYPANPSSQLMRPIQRLIHAGFATAAIASASVPALAWTVWPDVDFEWYANVGRAPAASSTVEPSATASAGQLRMSGAWAGYPVANQAASPTEERRVIPAGSSFSTTDRTIRDREGNAIPTSPEAYPVDRTR